MPKLEASIVADTRTVEEYFAGLSSGESDLFLSYTHSAFDFELDPKEFISMDVGLERMRLCGHPEMAELLTEQSSEPIPFIEFAGTSFLSRVVQSIVGRVPFEDRLSTVYAGTLAESLWSAAHQGLGVAWLPESIIRGHETSRLQELNHEYDEIMTIRMFRARRNSRPVVHDIWEALS